MIKIKLIRPEIILDSRQEKTIKVTIEDSHGLIGSASVPQGKSRGKFERDNLKPEEAFQKIKELESFLIKKNFETQEEFDYYLLELANQANVILPLSLAFARIMALKKKIPLWQNLKEIFQSEHKGEITKIKPRLFVNMIGGGLHAQNNLDFQEYLIIPKTKNAFEAWELSKKIYLVLGEYLKKRFKKLEFADEGNNATFLNDNEEPFLILKELLKKLKLENEIDLGLDAAATNISHQTPENLFKIYLNLKEKYQIFYLEDPFSENDFENFAKIKKEIGDNTLIVGDDLTVTNIERIDLAIKNKSLNGIIIKPNQIGNLTLTLKAIKKAKENNLAVIISHRSGETDDDFIADLSYGLGAEGLKAGAPLAKERLVKYQRLIEIEKHDS